MSDQFSPADLAAIRARLERLQTQAVWGKDLHPGFWVDITTLIHEDAPALLAIAEESADISVEEWPK